ncbi:putative nucleotidyltransferase [Limihaloglobus sulfuriphilus]|uniref:Putative nucleotidyltransferase n=1 Tax=Limihaloglobus sulfuriphilus TaxID=1851148 RepID=A0A1Q2MG42_9BACT|nr:nucleotidyltransferase domain-containing protein [Limihaloglobus sulfuriphilus]AQQ71518.1 putative nucleotidyltransferase [Limihaloglobus sulfuriphilus]
MIDIDKIKDEIVASLSPLKPDRVVLFGSFADGTPGEDSDVDLYVVTNDDFMPQDWSQKNEIYLNVSRRIRSLRSRVPVDLIVHTRKMHERFIELGSSFSRQITSQGERLI